MIKNKNVNSEKPEEFFRSDSIEFFRSLLYKDTRNYSNFYIKKFSGAMETKVIDKEINIKNILKGYSTEGALILIIYIKYGNNLLSSKIYFKNIKNEFIIDSRNKGELVTCGLDNIIIK
ncbi:MAG: hypothetical protein U0457_12255 [Candidatus Sericytochromatia bacterium]